MALVDAPAMAIIADIVDEMSGVSSEDSNQDVRDEALYGSAFALLDSLVSLGYASGPLLGACFEEASTSTAERAFRIMTLVFGVLCLVLAVVITLVFGRRKDAQSR